MYFFLLVKLGYKTVCLLLVIIRLVNVRRHEFYL